MKKKYEKITFVWMSYNKIHFNNKNKLTEFNKLNKFNKFSKLNEFKNLYIILYILKNTNNNIIIKFSNGKNYNKSYTLIKGPKCHKVGKHLIKYSYNIYYITFLKILNFNKSLINIQKYFIYLINSLNIYDTNLSSNNKIILNTYVDII